MEWITAVNPIWNTSVFENEMKGDTDTHRDPNPKKEVYFNSAGFLCLIIFVAVVLKESLKQYHFPFTVPLLIFGVVLGVLDGYFKTIAKMTIISRIDVIMQLFFPVIIYDYAFGMNPHKFTVAIGQCLILAVPGFVFCTALNSVFASTILSIYKWDWYTCILFGTILSVTETAAILQHLKDYGVSANLLTIIEGESMLTCSIACVFSKSLLKYLGGTELTMEDVILDLLKSCLGAVIFGYVLAMAVTALLRRTENDIDVEVTFSICSAYIAYLVSEIYLGVSGLLAVVVLGLSMSSYKSIIIYDEEVTTVHQVWKTLSFWANSLIFVMVGHIIASSKSTFELLDIGLIVASYFTASVVRGCMIFGLTPVLSRHGYGFSIKRGALLTWGGMRGAVGLALALLVRFTMESDPIDKLFIQVSGVIILTLIFNASTMRILLELLGIGQITDKNLESMAHAIALLQDAVDTTERVTRMDKYLAGADWVWVRKVTRIENPYENKESAQSSMMKRAFHTFRGRCRECKTEIRIEPNPDERRQIEMESRQLTLKTLKNSVANQHENHGILQRSLGHLKTCIDNAIDAPENYLLADDVKKTYLYKRHIVSFMKRHMMNLMNRLDLRYRQYRSEVYFLTRDTEASAFRKICIRLYTSGRLETILYWSLLTNLIPIIGEFVIMFRGYGVHSTDKSREILFYEIFNGVLTLIYVWDAVVRIVALRCRTYFRRRGNLIDFVVTLTAVLQLIYGIILLVTYKYTYNENSIYILASLSALRLVRLLKVTLTGMFRAILNEICGVYYNAFDLAIGFIVANEEMAKSVHKILPYEENAENARQTAEKNVYNMLCYVHEIEQQHPYVACAWRTHRATIYILKNMKEIIQEMAETYVIDETNAEELLDEINSKMQDTLGCPRYMRAREEVRSTLESMPWISDANVIDKIMENHKIQTFSDGEIIQSVEEMHPDLKVLHKGIIEISGYSSGEKTAILPNTDTMLYFYKKGVFRTYTNTPKSIGILGYLLQTPSVTSVSASNLSQLISIEFETISEIEKQGDSMSFHMWRTEAFQIALPVLRNEKAYQNWSDAKMKIHLEKGILPNLVGRVELDVHPVILDIVLIQGRVKDKDSVNIYVGPAYIPYTVRSLILLDDPRYRPRVIMILLREETFLAPSIMGWIKPEEITYKGVCLVHEIKRASHPNMQLLNTSSGRHRSLIQVLGDFLTRKDESRQNILNSP